MKQVTGKQMAYATPSPVRFPVGTRVIAIFQDNDWSKECYYSGVVAEPPKSMNKYRSVLISENLTKSEVMLEHRDLCLNYVVPIHLLSIYFLSNCPFAKQSTSMLGFNKLIRSMTERVMF
jgi:hypothetical protein